MDFLVTFADKPGQTGTQFLFEVNTEATGLTVSPSGAGVVKTVVADEKEVIAGTVVAGSVSPNNNPVPHLDQVSELAECSDRGLDNGDGECECFDGFRGLACEEQEALV